MTKQQIINVTFELVVTNVYGDTHVWWDLRTVLDHVAFDEEVVEHACCVSENEMLARRGLLTRRLR